MLQIVASLIDAARGVIYDRHMFIVQATGSFLGGEQASVIPRLPVVEQPVQFSDVRSRQRTSLPRSQTHPSP